MDPEEEEGEVSEPGSKDKFDIKKILDFPGFNVPASSRYKEVNSKFNAKASWFVLFIMVSRLKYSTTHLEILHLRHQGYRKVLLPRGRKAID